MKKNRSDFVLFYGGWGGGLHVPNINCAFQNHVSSEIENPTASQETEVHFSRFIKSCLWVLIVRLYFSFCLFKKLKNIDN